MHQNYDEDTNITWAVMLLSIITIFIGKLIQNNVLEFNSFIILPLGHKLLTIIVTFLGGWIAVVIWSRPGILKTGGNKIITFNSLM